MASKADLEAREAESNSVEDFVNLAQDALVDPADQDYASELADSAQLCMRMKVNGVDIDSVKNVYAAARSNMQNSSQRLQWAEGIMQLFRDREWAAREYDELAGEFTSGIEKQCYLASKKFRLQQSL